MAISSRKRRLLYSRRRSPQPASREQVQADEHLGLLFDASPIGIVNMNAEGRIVRANQAAQRLLGWSEAELCERGLSNLSHPADSPETCHLFSELVRGERGEFAQEKRYLRRDGSYVWASLTVAAVRGPQGEMRYTISMLQDISARKQAEEQRAQMLVAQQARADAVAAEQRMALLAEASRLFASSLDASEILRQVARVALPQLADWATVMLGGDGEPIRVYEMAHVDPARVALLQAITQRFPVDPQTPGGLAAVLRDGTSAFYAQITPEMLEASLADAEHRAMLLEVGLGSLLIVPLLARGQVRGAVTFARGPGRPDYTAADLALAEELGSRAGLALDNALLFGQTMTALHSQHQIEQKLLLLTQAAQTLLSTLSPAEVLPRLLDLSASLIAADAHALWRMRPDGQAWQVLAARNLSAAYQSEMAQSPAGVPNMLTAPIVVGDVEAEPQLAHRQASYRREGIRSMLVMPVLLGGQSQASLAFYYREPHAFDQLDQRVAEALAHMSAAAITTAELYAEQSQLRQLAEVHEQRAIFLAEVSSLLSGAVNPQARLNQLAQMVVPTIADWSAIFLVDDNGQPQPPTVFHADAAQRARAEALLRGFPLDLSALPEIGRLLHTCEPLVLPSLAEYLAAAPQAGPAELIRQLQLTSLLVLPMVARERIFGLVVLAMSESRRQYTDEIIGLAQDVVRRAAVAIDNAQLYAEMQQALNTRDQFLSVAAHEIKTPITALLGYTHLLSRRLEQQVEPRDLRSLRALADQARRLDRLSLSLLDIARIQLGRLTIEPAPLDLTWLVRRATDEQAQLSDRHAFKLDLPATPLQIHGDGLRLEQVVQNLLSNAIKYSPQGGPITVRLVAEPPIVRLSVADQGLGIPLQGQQQLFTPYFRAANVNPTQIGGMGLGLYVVHEIVMLHGGSIEVSSVEGQGSTFTVVLPLPAAD